MLYKIAPVVYAMPPATNQNKPSEDKFSINGLIAKTIIHPINTYIIVEIASYFPVKNNLRIIPVTAIPQVTPKTTQPVNPFSVTRVNGV